MNRLERIKGCVLGGAVGDALGAPVRALDGSAIVARFGPRGISDFAPAQGGCGALMRVAPCAFLASTAAALFADILQRLVEQEISLEHAITQSLARYGQVPGMDETLRLVERVLFFHEEGYQPTAQRISTLWGGWVAEEALAIGLWCALAARSFEEGVATAVSHGGNSGTTGRVTGHLLGIQHGVAAIPARWLERLRPRGIGK
jgi:ADP-ribosylglycohydrolase